MSSTEPPLKSTVSSEKVEFVSVLKMVLGGPVPDDVDVHQLLVEEVAHINDMPTIPLDTDDKILADAQTAELDQLRLIDDSALDLGVQEAQEAWDDDKGSESLKATAVRLREERRGIVSDMRKRYADAIAALEAALDTAEDDGPPADRRLLNAALLTAQTDHNALRARRRANHLDEIDYQKRKESAFGYDGIILAAPKSTMLVENPSTPGEFHEIDMSEYGPTLAHKTGELYLFEDGWVRKNTPDPGGLTVVSEMLMDDGTKMYKVNVMKKAAFLAGAKMSAIEELFSGHGGGFTEVVDTGTITGGTSDVPISEPRLVYRVGRHAPGLTIDQLKDRLRKGRIAHDAAWAAQGKGTSQFSSEEAYVEAYDASVKVLADAITASALPNDGTNYYSSYKVSVNHGKSIGHGFTRTLSNSQTNALPTADPDEFGTPSHTARKKIPDSAIVAVPDSTLVWSMANFNVSPTGDWVLAQFWPQDSAVASSTSVTGGEIKGTFYQGAKGPLLSTGSPTGPDDSDTILASKGGGSSVLDR